MKIYIGADHNGFQQKTKVADYLRRAGHTVVDEGGQSLDPDDDFPVFASRVVHALLQDTESDPRGVLVCGSGQGMIMAANRYKGIRAGLGWSTEAARSIRNDEDSNVISMPSKVFETDDWKMILDTWLKTPFAAATRYVRRIKELDEL